MIARIWKARTVLAHAEGFTRHLEATGLADYRAQDGCTSAYLLRRDEDGIAHFLLVSLWESLNTITAYSGPDLDLAVLYPGDEEFEVDSDTQARHYRVVVAANRRQ